MHYKGFNICRCSDMSAMGRSYRWIFFYVSLHIVIQHAYCQSNTYQAGPDFLCELSKEFSNPNSAKTQLMNTLLSVAASKGVLPELASALQPTLMLEKSQQPPTAQTQAPATSAPKTFNYMPFAPSGYTQECNNIHISQCQPGGPIQTSTGRPSSTIEEVIPQGIQQPSIQVIPLESQFNAFNGQTGPIQPGPVSCQPAVIGKECYRQFPISHPENNYPTPTTQSGQHTTSSFPTKVSLGNAECSCSYSPGCQHIHSPQVYNHDNEKSHLPEEVKITLTNSTELKEKCLPKEQALIKPHSDVISDCLSLPQILITKSKSKSGIKKLLPAILLAMLLDDHEDGSGCQCEPDSNKYIPIPYPIPIPINNLIMKAKQKSESSEDESPEEHDDNDC